MQRRQFVNNCIWITTGLLAGCSKSVNASKPITYTLLKGRVTTGGNGLADVIVSDGFNVIKTAADGTYEMNVPSNSRHVFVSVPSGYAFLHDKNIARHYISLDGTAFQKLDFALEALNINDKQHKFVVWADPQIRDESDLNKLMTKSIPDLLEYRQSLPSETLIHGILLGDIVFDTLPLFSTFNAAIDKCDIPFYSVIGNHDMAYDYGGDKCDFDFKATYGPVYYSYNRGQVHYVVLNDVLFVGAGSQYTGFFSTEQLDWLKKDLSFISRDKLIVISLHIPAAWLDTRSDLYEILKGYKVHIMSGHSHFNNNIEIGDIYEHIHGAVCGAWWTGPICSDGTPCGYAIYEVDGVNIEWHYKSIGYKKDFQIRTSVSKTGTPRLQANVWNWDPAWKVEWWSDDNFQGDMAKGNALDYLADELYTGDLPSGSSWVEPNITDHLFYVDIPNGTKQIKVLATDRFGKTYESLTRV